MNYYQSNSSLASLANNGQQMSNRSSSSNSKLQFAKNNNLGVITESNGEGEGSFTGDYAPKILMNSARTSNTQVTNSSRQPHMPTAQQESCLSSTLFQRLLQNQARLIDKAFIEDDDPENKENSLRKFNSQSFNIPEAFPLLTKHHQFNVSWHLLVDCVSQETKLIEVLSKQHLCISERLLGNLTVQKHLSPAKTTSAFNMFDLENQLL